MSRLFLLTELQILCRINSYIIMKTKAVIQMVEIFCESFSRKINHDVKVVLDKKQGHKDVTNEVSLQ